MGQRTDYVKGSHVLPDDFVGNGGGSRRDANDEKEHYFIGPDSTVYRYLCPLRKIGSIIGIGGDIAKQLRTQTNAKIRIGETIPGCDERVVTIYSPRDEINSYENEHVCPAQDALFRVHDRVMADEFPHNDPLEEPLQVTVRLLVPSDQIGCVIGKGGQIIQSLRNETHAQIRIMGSEHLPPCALSSDELIQISGEASAVKKALHEVANRLHDNPSRSQQSLLSSQSIYRSGLAFTSNLHVGGSSLHSTSLIGPYTKYKNDGRDRLSVTRLTREFTLRLVCPTENLGAVIGKGGSIIQQTRQESGAFIVVDSAGADDDDCIISISSKEIFETPSRTIDAIMRLQPRCCRRDSSDAVITTRLLVPRSRIGCIIGKGGAIINKIRSSSRASIRIFSDENVPKVASEDDELVQITGDGNAAKNALLQVSQRLRANLYEADVNSSAFPMHTPSFATSTEAFDGQKHMNHDKRSINPIYSTYSEDYSSKTFPPTDSFENYDDSQATDASSYGVSYPVY